MIEPINLDDARLFLRALDPEADQFTFQTFDDDKSRKDGALTKVLSGSIDELTPRLQALNERGAGVFVTVNETDLTGRKKENIKRVRAVWQEDDDGAGNTLPIEPHIEVSTSPGKAHRYILVDGLTPDDHAQVMGCMVASHGSDKNAATLERVLRVPGFYHRKGEPYLVRLVKADTMAQPIDRATLLAAFPAPAIASQKAHASAAGVATEYADDATIADLRSALNALRADDRGDWIRQGARLRSLGDVGRGLWLDWSATSSKFDLADASKEWDTIGHDRTGYKAVFKEAQLAGWLNPARRPQAKAGPSTTLATAILPALPADLSALPHGLGDLQRWIVGYMTQPSAAAAGFTALATLAHFAMPAIKILSRDALGLNEQFLLLAPTGFGKEDLRKPFSKLSEAVSTHPRVLAAGNLVFQRLAQIEYSAPASQQGLHRLLMKNRAHTFLSDEFAEWLGHAASDSHKQQALGHIMQAYSKAFETLAAPAIADTKAQYAPVSCPRVLVFATSTAERILETINASQADSGALNRFVILVAEQERIPKRYDVRAADFRPPAEVVELVAWLSALPTDTEVGFTDEALNYYQAHDSAVLDPLRFADARLAGRLNEQAFKMAALIALSDRRMEIEVRDLAIAYGIREGLYHRAASMIGQDGALGGMHPTGRALEQLRLRFAARPFIYRSNLPKESRQFAKLSVGERQAVERALQEAGFAKLEGGKLVSLIHEQAE